MNDQNTPMKNLDDVAVLIPAAGSVSEQLFALAQKLNSAMIPLNGRPVIYWLLSYLCSLGYRNIKIAVRSHDSLVERFTRTVFHSSLNLDFVVPDRDGGVGYSVLCLAERVETSKGLIVLGDTFFNFPDTSLANINESFLLVSPVDEYFRWCLVEKNAKSMAECFIDKPVSYEGSGEALIGVYGLNDLFLFKKYLHEVWEERGHAGKLELSSALEKYNRKRPMRCLQCEDWFDCGHPDYLVKSKKRMLSLRSVNRVSFDENLGTITKRSEDRCKFINEIQYYDLLPPDLKILFPRIVRSDCHADEPYLEMEYYGYPTLTELFVFETLDPNIWKRISRHLHRIMNIMREYKMPADNWCMQYMYLQKTEDRTHAIARSNKQLGSLLFEHSPLYINGESMARFSSLWTRARKVIEEIISGREFNIIHGDLCFSNILYDLNSDICKFIDPRGSFGHPGVYGDILYDGAKLYHSVYGLYDFIINDLFSINVEGDLCEFFIFAGEHVDRVQEVFREVLAKEFNMEHLLVVEGLLFLTMGVYHKDAPDRQKAMIIRGTQIWNEVLK